MYESDLDSRGLKKYLDFLMSRKFVEVNNTNVPTYAITPKGLEFLETHKRLELLQTT